MITPAMSSPSASKTRRSVAVSLYGTGMTVSATAGGIPRPQASRTGLSRSPSSETSFGTTLMSA